MGQQLSISHVPHQIIVYGLNLFCFPICWPDYLTCDLCAWTKSISLHTLVYFVRCIHLILHLKV